MKEFLKDVKIKVSIIVPVYNTKKEYLEQCLNSILNQTIKENIEIIVIDDGSTDSNCIKICDEYSEKYSNLYVVHQQNQGLAQARNNGMKIAKGKWIMFVDSDDWIEPDMCEKLLQIDATNAEIVITSYKECYKNKEVTRAILDENEKIWNNENEKLELQIILKEILKDEAYNTKMFGYVWGKLYRRSFLEQNKLNNFMKINYMEDCIFNLYCFEYAKTIIYKNYCLYHYRKRKNSICSKGTIKKVEDYLNFFEEEKKFIDIYKKPKIFYDAHQIRTANLTLALINKNIFIPKINYKEGKKIVKELMQIEEIKTAVNNVKFEYLTSYERICIILLRKKLYLLFKIIAFIRFSIKKVKFENQYFEE